MLKNVSNIDFSKVMKRLSDHQWTLLFLKKETMKMAFHLVIFNLSVNCSKGDNYIIINYQLSFYKFHNTNSENNLTEPPEFRWSFILMSVCTHNISCIFTVLWSVCYEFYIWLSELFSGPNYFFWFAYLLASSPVWYFLKL